MRKLSILTVAALLSVAWAEDAKQVLSTTGVTGGVVVHVGCGDGTLTAALRANDRYVVHGLATDAADVARARATIQKAGLYGHVSVDLLEGNRLPYVDNMVNLVVAEDLGSVAMSEVLRVLCPNGVAYVRQGGKWTLTRKPRPANIDDWTHYLHDADNNAVANDTVVGPPRRTQWQAGPKWTRHHDRMSSVSACVTSGGRLFYILDEGSTASIMLPSRWALICRDAFNGKVLWKRSIGTWYTRFMGLKSGPADAPRRLIAVDGRVYVTLSLDGPLSCLDADTGETLRDYADTKGAEEVILSGGVLFVLVGPGSIGDGGRQARPAEKRVLMALDAESGKKLWETSDVIAAMTPAADAERVYYFNFASKKLVGLDRRTGNKQWASEPLPTPEKQTSFFAQKLVVSDGVVLFASGEISGMIKSGGGARVDDTLTAVDAKTGKTLWKAKHPPSGYSSPENLFVIDGLVWCDESSNTALKGGAVAYDLKTGAVKRQLTSSGSPYWFHHRCHPGRATSNYILTSRTGIEFIDLQKKRWDLNHWVRGACLYGVMPANGLVYTPPNPCACYMEAMLHSFNAFAPERPLPEPVSERLVKGPAYGAAGSGQEAGGSGDWPTYRHNAARTGTTSSSVPAKLSTGWETKLGGKLSSVIVADGKLFVAAVDRHTVHALDAATGKPLWQFVAGGRVDSPPTYHAGSVLFGSADGCVYSVRASDGVLAWRFRAAPADQRAMIYGQIESLWPVHGSILVRDGIAYFVAGRSVFVDGGMRLYRLDARTGRVISQSVLDHRNPKTGKDLHELVQWLNMPVGRSDVLSSDGKRVYMRSQAFDLEGKRLAMGPSLRGPQEGRRQGGEDTHLFCPAGFLDDTWFHRQYWLYAKTWGSGWCGYYVAGKHAPAGRIMSVGDDLVYVFGRQPQYYRWTTPMEFRLFAAKKEWKAGPAKPQPAKKAAAKGGKKKRQPAAPGPVLNDANYAWQKSVPVLVRGMVLAGDTLFIAGPRDVLDETKVQRAPDGSEKALLRQEAAFRGEGGAVLWALSAKDGKRLTELELESPPVFDGLIAAGGRLYLSTMDGRVMCLK